MNELGQYTILLGLIIMLTSVMWFIVSPKPVRHDKG